MAPSERSDKPSDLVKLPRKNPEEFAAFARAHPRAAARAFDALPLEERVRLVAEARGAARRDLILLAQEPGPLVQAIPSVDLLLTLKEIGDDAPGLLRLASLRQVRLFIDLDAWRGDRIDIDNLEDWISLLQESGEKLGEAVPDLDRELLIKWLRGRIRVWKAEADGSIPEGAPNKLVTLDGVYQLEPLRPNDDLALVQAVLHTARGHSEKLYWQLLEGVIHEIDSDLETWAFRWRESRLNDEGFPSFDDALMVYARLDTARFDPASFAKSPIPPLPGGEEGAALTADTLMLRAAPRDSLLARAWSAGREAGGWDPLEEELAGLLNRVLVADRIGWDSPPDMRALFERASATLGIGLEAQVSKSPQEDPVRAAVDLLREIRLEALFRLGFSRTLEARDLALSAAPEEPGMDQAWTALLDPPLPEVIAGARQKRPLYWTGLEGVDEPEYREFRALAEIEATLDVLRLAAGLRDLFREVSGKAVPGSLGDAPRRRSPVRLHGLVITLFAWSTLEGSSSLRPLPVKSLGDLQAALFTASGPDCGEPVLKNSVTAVFHEAFAGWLAGIDPRARPCAEGFLDDCLERLRSEIGPLDSSNVDPRAVAAILLC